MNRAVPERVEAGVVEIEISKYQGGGREGRRGEGSEGRSPKRFPGRGKVNVVDNYDLGTFGEDTTGAVKGDREKVGGGGDSRGDIY